MKQSQGIPVETLLEKYRDYLDGYAAIQKQVDTGKLIPIRSSGSNGMKPPLYRRYRRPVTKKENGPLLKEMRKTIMPPLSISFYERHPAQYEKNRDMILALQEWLFDHPLPPEEVSMNERSFEIFHREKVLSEHGNRLLRNLHIDPARLAIYETCEPVSSFSARRRPGPILIVENLDPFVTIRRLLIEGETTICGMPVETVVYGAGKKIIRTFRDLLEFGPPEVLESLDQIYYWGDLDWEGMQIYESLRAAWPDQTFHPFEHGYRAMLEKALNMSVDELPQTKDGQKECLSSPVLNALGSDQDAFLDILAERRYIPQEILNAKEYRSPDQKASVCPNSEAAGESGYKYMEELQEDDIEQEGERHD